MAHSFMVGEPDDQDFETSIPWYSLSHVPDILSFIAEIKYLFHDYRCRERIETTLLKARGIN